MKNFLLILCVSAFFISCKENSIKVSAESPSSKIKLDFDVNKDGQPYYMVHFNNKTIIDTSFMSFDFKDLASLKEDFKIVGSTFGTADETWQMPWGEQLDVRNHYNELVVNLEEQSELKRKLNIHFKIYDDGLGFRYEFPEQENLKEVLITDENTQFNLTGDHKVWWIPGDWDIYEHLYSETKFSEIDALSKQNNANLNATYIPENAVNTPVTMKTDDGLYLSFHEADLTNYSGMTLKVDSKNLDMVNSRIIFK